MTDRPTLAQTPNPYPCPTCGEMLAWGQHERAHVCPRLERPSEGPWFYRDREYATREEAEAAKSAATTAMRGIAGTRGFFPTDRSTTVKCPECVKAGERSTVQDLGGSTTLMGFSPYYDEDGAYHCHDPNRHTVGYRCSRGHQWATSFVSACPSCDYGREKVARYEATDEAKI